MSLLELKLTLLEDYCKKNEDRWHREYIREHWKLDTNLKIKVKEGFEMLKEKEIIGTCCLWGGRVNIYEYNKDTESVLTKVYPNVCNDFKEYNWQRYGVGNIILNSK